ncbi:MAG: sulfite exporter TauE/SafE family protein [Solirubrobacteraceae bacterium]
MSPFHIVAIFAAGIVAGTINTIVGSGTLFTFPVLLAFGYAPVVANVSNTVGLVPGSASGALGYRRELRGQGRRLAPLAVASVTGGVIGAVLLLSLPASAFAAIVPGFIALALVLIIFQPRIGALLARRRADQAAAGDGVGTEPGTHRAVAREFAGPLATLGVLVGGIYGGYFGAAQGIMLLAILTLSIDDHLQRINALKVVLAGLVNLVSGIIFVLVANVAWGPAALIAAGSLLGGILGARVGRRLPPQILRGVIVIVGVAAIVHLVA